VEANYYLCNRFGDFTGTIFIIYAAVFAELFEKFHPGNPEHNTTGIQRTGRGAISQRAE